MHSTIQQYLLLLFLFLHPCMLKAKDSSTIGPRTTVKSYYEASKKLFITEGSTPLKVSWQQLSRVGQDFGEYRFWALEGINGGEDNPRDFLVLLKDIVYEGQPKLGGRVLIVYDLDLVFPFGRKDAALQFKLADLVFKEGLLIQYALRLSQDSFAVDSFDLQVRLDELGSGASEIHFTSTMKMSYLINVFFNLEKYRSNIEWRILKMMSNFKDQSLNYSPTAND